MTNMALKMIKRKKERDEFIGVVWFYVNQEITEHFFIDTNSKCSNPYENQELECLFSR